MHVYAKTAHACVLARMSMHAIHAHIHTQTICRQGSTSTASSTMYVYMHTYIIHAYTPDVDETLLREHVDGVLVSPSECVCTDPFLSSVYVCVYIYIYI